MKAYKRKILVATGNPGKIVELRSMLDFDIDFVGLENYTGIQVPEEDGTTFAENARKKALHYALATGLWTIADDSGLCVDALAGAPGINSARFSGEHSNTADRKIIDKANIKKLLQLLKDVPPEKRTARFVCRLCLAAGEKVLIETEGVLEGIILDKEMGTGGFGYDPVFFVPRLKKTVAQLKKDEKNAISHRGEAVRKLKPLLQQLI